MIIKTFLSLFIAFLMSMFGGALSLILLSILFTDYSPKEDFFTIFISMFVDFFFAVLLCGVFFHPIAIFDRKNIPNNSFEELIRRYLPIITLPLSVLVCFAFFSDYDSKSDYYFRITTSLNILCMSYVGLWTFLKKLKSL